VILHLVAGNEKFYADGKVTVNCLIFVNEIDTIAGKRYQSIHLYMMH
jgi:AAA+ superfamily predicted ATPase